MVYLSRPPSLATLLHACRHRECFGGQFLFRGSLDVKLGTQKIVAAVGRVQTANLKESTSSLEEVGGFAFNTV